ncbi:LysR family transcriptional regulator [Rhodovastum atsumiense]|nr:LysR family transcriptional regulator [Rhodovastum atsumiense]
MVSLVDWDDLRFFLAVARSGSFSVAARSLRVTQSTVGRRIASLEAAMGARLLHRTTEGYVPTEAGEAILSHVERVEAETLALVRAVQGYDSRLEGNVRVAAPDFVASRLLVPAFSALNLRFPKISIELLQSGAWQGFSAKECDLSIRAGRFEQPDLVVRLLGRLSFRLYASAGYLAAHGHPNFDDACEGHRLIVGDTMSGPTEAAWLQAMTGRATIALKAASFETLLGAVASGYGIAALPRFVAESTIYPALVRLTPPTPAPHVELWLGVHRETRSSARVRQVIDAAAKAIAAQERLLNPPDIGLVSPVSEVVSHVALRASA